MAAEHFHSLYGGCSCGRNQYTVSLPSSSRQDASVYFDNSTESRRTHATPLSAYLVIPLSWFRSSTYAFYPDESHASIRRTYHTSSLAHGPRPHASPTPQHDRPAPHRNAPDPSGTEDDQQPREHAQRTFCGYCGTPLTSWLETPTEPSSAESISVALGSLRDEDVTRLDELGLLPSANDPDDEDEDAGTDSAKSDAGDADDEDNDAEVAEARQRAGASDIEKRVRGGDASAGESQSRTATRNARGGAPGTVGRGMPWFEELVSDSALGRVRRRRGGRNSGGERVEWEIVEIGDDGDHEGAGSSLRTARTTKRTVKRKLGPGDAAAEGESEDVHMGGE